LTALEGAGAPDSELIGLAVEYLREQRRYRQICSEPGGENSAAGTATSDRIGDLARACARCEARSGRGVLAKLTVLANWKRWNNPRLLYNNDLGDDLRLSLAADLELHLADYAGETAVEHMESRP